MREQFYYYEATQLNVSITGYYTIRSSSGLVTMDTYGYIYNNTFNASISRINLLQENNDDAGKFQFLLNITLLSSAQYTMVVTTYLPRNIGSFSIFAIGPGSVYFSQATLKYSNKSKNKTKSTVDLSTTKAENR